jgi:DNA-binding response OmpR family regulator/predicted regulator of Ras-like GTPase activity (Roadblock/LC7/MglB family)
MMASRGRALVAEEDPRTQALLQATLRQAGFEPVVVADGEAAWRHLEEADPPRVVLLAGSIAGLDGFELCRRLRARPSRSYVYVFLLSDRGSKQDLLAGLEAGADDLLAKPFLPEELVVRLGVADRVVALETGAMGDAPGAFQEALESSGGELLVKSGEQVGRVFVLQGRVVWADLSGEPASLQEILEGVEGLDRGELRRVLAECRRTGRNVAEALIDEGLIEREVLRARLLAWLSRKVRSILALPHPSALFVPGTRQHTGDLAFTRDELGLDAPASSARPPSVRVMLPVPAPSPGVLAVLDRVRAEVSYFLSTDVVALASGVSVGSLTLDGQEPTPDDSSEAAAILFAEMLHTSRRAVELLGLGGAVEDVLLTVPGGHVILRALGAHYFQRLTIGRQGTPGHARVILGRHAPALLDALPATPPGR